MFYLLLHKISKYEIRDYELNSPKQRHKNNYNTAFLNSNKPDNEV